MRLYASPERERVSVVIADDNSALQTLLEVLLSAHPDVRVACVCPDGATAVERVLERAADVALLDDDMPRMNGLRAAEVIRACAPHAEPILFTATPQLLARDAAAIGVRVIDKLDSRDLVRQIVEAGEKARTRPADPVKARVARGVIRGLTRSQMPKKS